MKNNPYAGPRPFERGEANLYGREREARELLWLILAERAVLFYAQSGAGKTSLLNARVIPDLEKKGFSVPPVVRVGNDLPPGVDPAAVANIFVFSALSGLAEGKPVAVEQLPGYTLSAFLNEFYLGPQNAETRRPLVLIFDQFEELFTRHPARWQDGLGFFQQLRQALDATPGLSVVLAMREDHLAGLDPYLPLLPSHLQARFRLEALNHKQAQEAIEKPARQAGYEFEDGAVQQLVTDLSQIKIQRYATDGIEEVTTDGQYIEPVQLQVVCSQLWANLDEPEGGLIPCRAVREHGDVTQALTGFYTQSLALAARATGVKERDLRRWFSERLITPVHTRGLALQGAQDTAGLPNPAVQILEQAHLIRADVRAGARWYELAHDRLIEPVVQSNRAWEAARQTPLRITARQWQSMKNTGLLYRERALREARAWVSTHPDEVEPYEQEFLDASLQAEQSRIRRRRWYIGGGVTAILIVAAMAILTLLAVRGQQAAVAQAHISEYRRLAAQAVANQDRNPDLALLLGVEANRIENNAETRNALLNVLQNKPQLAAYLHGHSDRVSSVAFSPDGKILASASYDNTVRLWDVTTRQPLGQPLRGHKSLVNSVAFSPDGKTLASGSADNTIILWDVTTRQTVGMPLQGHTNFVNSVAFSPDGKILASGSKDKTIRLWDMTTRQPLGQPLTGHASEVFSIAFSPDGKMLASGSFDRTVRLWDVTTRQPLGEPLAGHADLVKSVAFSPDGILLASGSWDTTIRLWNVRTRQLSGEPFEGHTGYVSSVAFSPDGKTLVSGSWNKAIQLWNVNTRQAIGGPFEGHTGDVNSVAFSPNGKLLASGSWDRTVRLWEGSARQPLGEPLIGSSSSAGQIAFSPDGKLLAARSAVSSILLWDMTTHQRLGDPLKKHTDLVTRLAFSPDSKILASGSMDDTIQLWDVVTRQPLGEPLQGHTQDVYSVAFSPDGKILASGSWDKTIRLWDVANRQLIGEPLRGHTSYVRSVAFSPDGKILASGGSDNTIRLWDVATRQPIGQPLEGHTGYVKTVAFSPDGKLLASGSWDKTIRLWNVATRLPDGEPLKGHTGDVNDVVFSPDGKTLASGSWDKTIRLWDVATHQPLGQPLLWHTIDVDSIAFSPDGKILASGSGGIFLWDINPTTWQTRACQTANRNLTQAEWLQYLNPDPTSYATEYARRPTCPELPVP